jgi:hypothetical protein
VDPQQQESRMNAPERIDTTALTTESKPLLVPANFKITTHEQYALAGPQLTGIKALLKKIGETFDPHIKRAFDAHKALVAEKRTHEAPLVTAETTLKRALIGFQQDQERQRQEQERKAREAAEKEAAKIREQAAKAEAAARAKADELRRQQEEAERAGRAAEAARLAEKAASVEAAGAEKAAGLQDKAALIPTPTIAVETPKVAGISTRTTYRAEVTDVDALIAAVAAGKVPKQALIPNEKFLNEQARSYKSALNWPGVKVVEDQGISSRSA